MTQNPTTEAVEQMIAELIGVEASLDEARQRLRKALALGPVAARATATPWDPDDDGDHSAFTHRDNDEPPPYVRESEARATAPAETTFAWLIERGQERGTKPTIYWKSRGALPSFGDEWTHDPWRAARFSSRETAQEAIAGLDARGEAVGDPVEHGFARATAPAGLDVERLAAEAIHARRHPERAGSIGSGICDCVQWAREVLAALAASGEKR